VLGLIHVDQAIDLANGGRYVNLACIFTASGQAARSYRYAADAGNVGVYIGVAGPMALLPFRWWKESFLGDLHGQAMDAGTSSRRRRLSLSAGPKPGRGRSSVGPSTGDALSMPACAAHAMTSLPLGGVSSRRGD